MKNHVAIAIGLGAGLAFGLIAEATQVPLLLRAADVVTPVGTIFVNLIKMVVIPLVVATLVSGTAGLGDVRRVGGLGIRALLFFWSTSVVSIVMGMLVMTLALPLMGHVTVAAVQHVDVPAAPGIIDFITGLIPA